MMVYFYIIIYTLVLQPLVMLRINVQINIQPIFTCVFAIFSQILHLIEFLYVFRMFVYRLALDIKPSRKSMKRYIMEGVDWIRKQYKAYHNDVERMAELAERAIFLLDNGKTDLENIGHLGEGWTGEEALAIALYCSLKHFDCFEDAMIAAVNHGGDSDSTGAVTGNILGAAIGYEAIPQYYKDDLEMHDLILHMADDLYRGQITEM